MCESIVLMAGWFLELLGPSKKHPPDGRWALSRAAERGMMAAFFSGWILAKNLMATSRNFFRLDSGEESDGNFADFFAGFWSRIRGIKVF